MNFKHRLKNATSLARGEGLQHPDSRGWPLGARHPPRLPAATLAAGWLSFLVLAHTCRPLNRKRGLILTGTAAALRTRHSIRYWCGVRPVSAEKILVK